MGGWGGSFPLRMLSFPPKREGKIGGERESERERERGRGGRGREEEREREREEEREGYYTQHYLDTYGLLLHVALLEDDWLLPSFTTNRFCIPV